MEGAGMRMTRRDMLSLGLLAGMSVFLFADQRIMSAILPELAAEYGVSERIPGFTGSAFVLVGAFVSIFFGYFTDRISRKRLLILVVVIGEIPCGLIFFLIAKTLGPDRKALQKLMAERAGEMRQV
jgi:predicted MFS family arabinose efflux permease